jgi:uncharacterized Zn-binding protein involved in type VI secretion
LTDPVSCPIPGHGTNAIAKGSQDVLFNGLPAARLSDPSECGGALSGNLAGTVFINGLNAATLGSTHSHGGSVIAGSGSILIGNSVVTAPFPPPAPLNIQAANWINFSITAPESYSGLSCTAHFDDGSTLSGVFDDSNQVRFSPTGKVCQRLEYGVQEQSEYPSVMSDLLKNILG